MFELGGRRSRSQERDPADSAWPGPLDQAEQRELADDAVPIPDSPHVARLVSSKGGPYYLTPDSAEPLPEGMWAELDPDQVVAEANRINARPEGERTTTQLPEDLRERLAAGGPAAHKLLQTLDRRDSLDPAETSGASETHQD